VLVDPLTKKIYEKKIWMYSVKNDLVWY